MSKDRFTLWTNYPFPENLLEELRQAIAPNRIILSPERPTIQIAPGNPDPSFAEADFALGQPNIQDVLNSKRLRWIQLSSAGYAAYDNPEFMEHIAKNEIIFTTGSGVYAEACAQHLLSMMLALSRQLLPSYKKQITNQEWSSLEFRPGTEILRQPTILLLGYGNIARHLTRLLAPFQPKLYALRRSARSEPGVRIISEAQLTAVLPEVDHLIDILPSSESTHHYVNARRLACLKPSARFYNIGRGTTVDHNALQEALIQNRLAAAYLDVTDPEPLPSSHPLWTTPNCFITPHLGGISKDSHRFMLDEFLHNLKALKAREPLQDQVHWRS